MHVKITGLACQEVFCYNSNMSTRQYFKEKIINVLSKSYGFNTVDARCMYEIMIECLLEVLAEQGSIRINRIGEITFKAGKRGKNGARMRVSKFRAAPELVYKAAGQDYNYYVESKKKLAQKSVEKRKQDKEKK